MARSRRWLGLKACTPLLSTGPGIEGWVGLQGGFWKWGVWELLFFASWRILTCFQSESPSSRLCSLLLLFLEKCQDSHVEHQLGTTEELGFRPVRDLDVTLTYRATVEGWVETQRSFRSFENIGWDGPTMALRLDLAQTSCLINKVLFWHIAVPLCILSVIVLLYSSRGESFWQRPCDL